MNSRIQDMDFDVHPRGDRYKWWLLAFLFVTYFLEQGARQVYNATLPQIKADFAAFGVTNTELGVVGTVFGAVFGMSLVGSGIEADFVEVQSHSCCRHSLVFNECA